MLCFHRRRLFERRLFSGRFAGRWHAHCTTLVATAAGSANFKSLTPCTTQCELAPLLSLIHTPAPRLIDTAVCRRILSCQATHAASAPTASAAAARRAAHGGCYARVVLMRR